MLTCGTILWPIRRAHGLVVMTPDFESGDLGSNPSGPYFFFSSSLHVYSLAFLGVCIFASEAGLTRQTRIGSLPLPWSHHDERDHGSHQILSSRIEGRRGTSAERGPAERSRALLLDGTDEVGPSTPGAGGIHARRAARRGPELAGDAGCCRAAALRPVPGCGELQNPFANLVGHEGVLIGH